DDAVRFRLGLGARERADGRALLLGRGALDVALEGRDGVRVGLALLAGRVEEALLVRSGGADILGVPDGVPGLDLLAVEAVAVLAVAHVGPGDEDAVLDGL